jgi:hypothetical protein
MGVILEASAEKTMYIFVSSQQNAGENNDAKKTNEVF